MTARPATLRPLPERPAGHPTPERPTGPSANLVERLEEAARDGGRLDRPAYIVQGRVFRHADVYEGAARAAAAYAARGLGRGSRILIALPDGVDFVWAFLGALRVGAVAVPVNSLLHPDELRRAGEIAEPHAAVATPELAGHFAPPVVLTPDDLDADPARAGSAPPYAACSPDTPAFAVFTSGTTGDPRLCFHTHGDPEVFDLAIGTAVGVGPGDVCFSVSRLYFAYGLGNSLFLPLLRGATTILSPPRATEDDAVTVIKEHGVTVFYGQPSFYARLLGHPGHDVLGTLRTAVVAGEVLPEALERRLRGILGERLLNVFGTTEIGHAMLANGPGVVREHTLGRVLPPYRVRVVDDDGREVPAGTEGSLQVAGPTIGPGVARGGDAPARLTPDEWYTTGDAATVDGDGFVRVHGRLDDIEIVGGANVHPSEIEDLLLEHPGVREAAVCSVRRGAGVSGLRAFVVPAEGAGDPERLRAELLDTARARLTWYKAPEDVVFVPELPRNPTGKLLRRKLRLMAGKEGLRP
ncbi:hypothetical protein Skr01_57710 [Sphaerisporangium krabiense]|uniref:Fatty acid CoA ligase FadD22 n=1 Tax=Sphaerisporangium krabiense TaxID=763782 RepID=A0A7W8Z8P2_9ACTN|nr:AMP-binding protein [Sphaerisporangium krabiense]MBB5629464.1 fatty acid CoA ligase FadD22 [Sphaerisporangium krabiense]GII65686.1 hypothetical protein Skr01_57710 [Sphaerisporangium krabiense]